MDEAILAYFRQILTDRLYQIERDIGVVLSIFQERGDRQDPMDEVDATSARSAWEAMAQLQNRNRISAFQINAALQRIRQGDFGICEECGESIGLKRLEAHPLATVCIQCKRREETIQRLKVA